MADYTSGQVAEIVGVVSQTVRDWSDAYADFLSPSARPAKGEIRRYTPDDVRVLLTVKREGDRRLAPEAIKAILDVRNNWVREIPEPVDTEKEVVPASQHALALARIDALSKELERSRNDHERELKQITAEKERLIMATKESLERTQQEVGELRDQLSDAATRIEDLKYSLGKVEGQLDELRRQRDTEARGGSLFGTRS